MSDDKKEQPVMDEWQCVRCGDKFKVPRGKAAFICENPNCGKRGPFEALSGPYRFFTMGARALFVPKQLGEYLKTKYRFLTDRRSHECYAYVNGRYDNTGEERIQELVREELSELSHEREVNETMNYIKETTYVDIDDLLAPCNLISFKNGYLNTDGWSFTPEHTPDFVFLNEIPHDYDSEQKCPNFLKWLGETVHKEDHDFLQEWAGYQFWRAVPEAAFLILTGEGQNGKGIWNTVWYHILGNRNISNVTLAKLTYDDFCLIKMYHKLANIAGELQSYVIKDAANLRLVSSGERVEARDLYQRSRGFDPYTKLMFNSNEPPEIRDTTNATKSRLKVIDFPFTFKKSPVGDEKPARDKKELTAELKAETQGIINWALEGLKRLIKNNFTFSTAKSTEEMWTFYERKSKPVQVFHEEELDFTDDEDDAILPEEMHKRFEAWIKEKKIKRKITRNMFFRDMKEIGMQLVQSRVYDRKRVYVGVRFSHGDTPKLRKEVGPLDKY